LDYWETDAEAKIALKIENEDEMNKLYSEAKKINLPAYIIVDAGRTQIKSGTKTVLAIGPGILFFKISTCKF
jgi:peptidyl-tRNA hydrolase, PTH2 family